MLFYFKWLLLSRLIGSPLGALAVLIAGGWAVDHFTLGVLPRPLRGLNRWRRARALRQLLRVNPNDRRARFELADLLQRRRPRETMALLKPNLEAGDTDPGTLLVMGVACFSAGHASEGDLFLRGAIEEAKTFRSGVLWLELGRGQLGCGNDEGAHKAIESLRELLRARPGSIEGKVLLAKALRATGDQAGSRALCAQAWDDYRGAPAFQRREERLWAYRAQPWRIAPWLGLVASAVTIGWWLQ